MFYFPPYFKKKEMEKLSVKEKIAEALIFSHSLTDDERSFLTVEQIAKIAYGESYMEETSKYLNGLVKRNISHSIAMLFEKDFLVIRNVKNGVSGYRIAYKEDINLILATIKSRAEGLASTF